MSNLVSFSAPLGINVQSSLVANSSFFQAQTFSTNSTAANVSANLQATQNISANNISGNNETFLSLTSNQVFVNTLSGNVETVISFTSNELFVNSFSGNTVTGFKNLTSNQIFVNTISGNIYTFTTFTANVITTNDIKAGNSTIYTEVANDGIYWASSAGVAKHMPFEVILQSGSVADNNNFVVDFSSEVGLGIFYSMKLVVSNIVTDSNNTQITLQYSSDGSTIITSGYRTGKVFLGSSGVDGSQDSSTQAAIGIGTSGNTSVMGGVEIVLCDTNNSAGIKCCYGIGQYGRTESNTIIFGAYQSTSTNLKGLKVSTATGNFTSCSWVLLGRRFYGV